MGIAILNKPHLNHVAIIMDGNGRWANERGLARVLGHQQGATNVRKIVEGAKARGIKTLSLFAFSSENWNRPKAEVSALMQLIHQYIEADKEILKKNDIELVTIGRLDKLPPATKRVIDSARDYLKDCKSMKLIVALSYGGREEIVDMCRMAAAKVLSGAMQPEDITEESLSAFSYSHGVKDPDLLIRTSGEQRISNYYLWQSAYTEMFFSEKYWPDFSDSDLDKAIEWYRARTRRFGKIDSQIENSTETKSAQHLPHRDSKEKNPEDINISEASLIIESVKSLQSNMMRHS